MNPGTDPVADVVNTVAADGRAAVAASAAAGHACPGSSGVSGGCWQMESVSLRRFEG